MGLIVWTIKDLVGCIEDMTNNQKFDCNIAIEGNRGLGKSTLGYKISKRLKIKNKFKPTRDLVYSQEDVLKHLSIKKGSIIFGDEMVNVAYKRNFYQEGQKKLIQILNMYRDSCNVFIMAIPKFIDLDRDLQRMVKIRISVEERGFALIHLQRHTIFNDDPWDIKYNTKIEGAWANSRGKKPQYSKLSTVVGVLFFGDLKPKQRAVYEAIKQKKRGKANAYENNSLEDGETKFYDNITTLLKSGQIDKKTFLTICGVNGKKPDTVRKSINLRLKQLGDSKRFKDYTMTNKGKIRKDKLGFADGYLNELEANLDDKISSTPPDGEQDEDG